MDELIRNEVSKREYEAFDVGLLHGAQPRWGVSGWVDLLRECMRSQSAVAKCVEGLEIARWASIGILLPIIVLQPGDFRRFRFGGQSDHGRWKCCDGTRSASSKRTRGGQSAPPSRPRRWPQRSCCSPLRRRVEQRGRLPLGFVSRQTVRRDREGARARLRRDAAMHASHLSPRARGRAEGCRDAVDQRTRDAAHYSTASADEQRAGIAKVIDLATGREPRAA